MVSQRLNIMAQKTVTQIYSVSALTKKLKRGGYEIDCDLERHYAEVRPGAISRRIEKQVKRIEDRCVKEN